MKKHVELGVTNAPSFDRSLKLSINIASKDSFRLANVRIQTGEIAVLFLGNHGDIQPHLLLIDGYAHQVVKREK